MDGKLLARSAAAVFVGIAFAMTLVQMREEPPSREPMRTHVAAVEDNGLSARLRACAVMGEAALASSDCLAAWAEKRRRFFGVVHLDAYADLARESAPTTSPTPDMGNQ